MQSAAATRAGVEYDNLLYGCGVRCLHLPSSAWRRTLNPLQELSFSPFTILPVTRPHGLGKGLCTEAPEIRTAGRPRLEPDDHGLWHHPLISGCLALLLPVPRLCSICVIPRPGLDARRCLSLRTNCRPQVFGPTTDDGVPEQFRDSWVPPSEFDAPPGVGRLACRKRRRAEELPGTLNAPQPFFMTRVHPSPGSLPGTVRCAGLGRSLTRQKSLD